MTNHNWDKIVKIIHSINVNDDTALDEVTKKLVSFGIDPETERKDCLMKLEHVFAEARRTRLTAARQRKRRNIWEKKEYAARVRSMPIDAVKRELRQFGQVIPLYRDFEKLTHDDLRSLLVDLLLTQKETE